MSSSPDQPVVSITNVQVQFGGGRVRAVDTVSLDVGRGEVVALVGESGCGKTTLIRSIVGLEPLAHGSIAVEGTPVRKGRGLRAVRRRVQLIFQDPSGALNPRHSIYEAVAEGLRIHKVKGHEPTLVAEALTAAGLRPAERYLGRFPHELSGGQRGWNRQPLGTRDGSGVSPWRICCSIPSISGTTLSSACV